MMPINAFIKEVDRRLQILRQQLRSESPQRRQTIQEAYKLSGDVYVEELGTIANISNGVGEFFYTAETELLRGETLKVASEPRRELFQKLGNQLKRKSRVLVIGAGSDFDLIDSLRLCGHEVIATDFGQDIIRRLQNKYDVPSFACDLVYLDTILPEPVDYIVANSVLGYLDPRKLKKITDNIWHSFTQAGIFTFDMTPHPFYFDIAEEKTSQTLVNPSAADPRMLTKFINTHGVRQGIAAMSHYTVMRGSIVNYAMLSVLGDAFEKYGSKPALGEYKIRVAGEGTISCPMLRIDKEDNNILLPIESETPHSTATEAIEASSDLKPRFSLTYIDREAAEPLAHAIGIHTSARMDAWNVITYVDNNQATATEVEAQKQVALSELNLDVAKKRILFAIENGFKPAKRMRMSLIKEQTLRKGVVTGMFPITPEQADLRIDEIHKQEKEKILLKERNKQSKEMRKKNQKESRQARKKQR